MAGTDGVSRLTPCNKGRKQTYLNYHCEGIFWIFLACDVFQNIWGAPSDGCYWRHHPCAKVHSAAPQYPTGHPSKDPTGPRSCETSATNRPISPRPDRHIGSSASGAPAKSQSDATIAAWHPSPSCQLLHRVLIIVQGIPLSPHRIQLPPTRHFRLGMSTNEYWKNSDNRIVRWNKFISDVFVSIKVSCFYVNKNCPHHI